LPSGCLYAPIEFVKSNPNTTQALANAIVRADKWITRSSPAEIAKHVPAQYLLGEPALYVLAVEKMKEGVSQDGLVSDAGARATLAALRQFDPAVANAEIRLELTYTNEFAMKANAKYK
jgi:NitT/TauT family transport system substrate-binding protein